MAMVDHEIPPGLREALRAGRVDMENGRNAWQKPVIAALWGLVLLFAGWSWSDAKDTRERLALQQQTSLERIATLEEAARNTRDALQRIEAGVNELRRERNR